MSRTGCSYLGTNLAGYSRNTPRRDMKFYEDQTDQGKFAIVQCNLRNCPSSTKSTFVRSLLHLACSFELSITATEITTKRNVTKSNRGQKKSPSFQGRVSTLQSPSVLVSVKNIFHCSKVCNKIKNKSVETCIAHLSFGYSGKILKRR